MYFHIAEMIPPVEGIDLGGDWNGWRRPAFPKASAEAIVQAHDQFYEDLADATRAGPGPDGAYAWFDSETREYVFYHPDSDGTDRYMVERTCGGACPPEGIETWSIGTGGWTWEAAPLTRITLTFDVVGPDEPTVVDATLNAMLDDGTIQQAMDPDDEWTFLQSDAKTEAL
jgi:hypothetical protein